jgi:hypothetical protein
MAQFLMWKSKTSLVGMPASANPGNSPWRPSLEKSSSRTFQTKIRRLFGTSLKCALREGGNATRPQIEAYARGVAQSIHRLVKAGGS